jgi:hypothetical protein
VKAAASFRAENVIVAVWVACFLIGTATHSLTLFHRGWLPYEWVPLPVNVFWTLLTFADPLAALLLVVRRNAGIVLGLSIMVLDVAINTWIATGPGFSGLSRPLQAQTLFFGFTLGSFRLIWRKKGT